jgi:hypothetical protein
MLENNFQVSTMAENGFYYDRNVARIIAWFMRRPTKVFLSAQPFNHLV